MTQLLYLEDPYLAMFSAQVIDVRNNEIILDRTAFYPGGGGQPADTGIIKDGERELKITGMNREDSGHITEGELPKIGAEVVGIIDWERRYKLMRTHTAVHVISGVAYNEFGVTITGNQLYEAKARLDLSFENLSHNMAESIIEKSNRVIDKDLEVKWYYIDKDDFLKNKNLMRVSPKLYEKYDKIRVVEIVNFDVQADGGTHVKHLHEIGEINIEKYQSKGKKNKRIYISLSDSK